jgi:hypothetical protein
MENQNLRVLMVAVRGFFAGLEAPTNTRFFNLHELYNYIVQCFMQLERAVAVGEEDAGEIQHLFLAIRQAVIDCDDLLVADRNILINLLFESGIRVFVENMTREQFLETPLPARFNRVPLRMMPRNRNVICFAFGGFVACNVAVFWGIIIGALFSISISFGLTQGSITGAVIGVLIGALLGGLLGGMVHGFDLCGGFSAFMGVKHAIRFFRGFRFGRYIPLFWPAWALY